MTNVQVRDVPEDVVRNLKTLAERHGLSLQGYLQDLLAAEAAVVTTGQILDEVEAALNGLPEFEDDSVTIIGRSRDERLRAIEEADGG